MIYIEEINNTSWEVLIIIVFIFFFLFFLYRLSKLNKQNKKLEEELKKLKYSKDSLSSETSSLVKSTPVLTPKEETKPLSSSKSEIKSPNPKIKESKETSSLSNPNKAYQKNVLKNIKAPTSPINITNQSPSIKELKMDLNDFIKKERKNGNNVRILTSKDYETSSSSTISYMEEVSKRLEEAHNDDPIELTDYEKKQEEEAIISYQELIENKDKIYQLADTDDEADIEFINELKNFRESLNKETSSSKSR